MKKIHILLLLLIAFTMSGCIKSNNQINNKVPAVKAPEIPQDITNTILFDCEENKKIFLGYSDKFFGGKSYIDWCEDCVKNNGKPQISEDAGPFCNVKTSDGGKKCTDSSQCEGYCIAENKDSTFGFCTEYQQLIGDGCGWLELVNGKVFELCVS